MCFDVGLKNGLATGAVGHVELQDARLLAHFDDLRLHRFGFLAAGAAMQHDVIAAFGQAQGNRPADATAGAGDQNGFAQGCCFAHG